jgi:hypothetical protein
MADYHIINAIWQYKTSPPLSGQTRLRSSAFAGIVLRAASFVCRDFQANDAAVLPAALKIKKLRSSECVIIFRADQVVMVGSANVDALSAKSRRIGLKARRTQSAV